MRALHTVARVGFVLLALSSLFFAPAAIQADPNPPCGIEHFNITSPEWLAGNQQAARLGNTFHPECPNDAYSLCVVNGLDSIYGHDGSDINSTPIRVWCSNPIPPPSPPALDPGPSCLAGSNRTVQLIPAGGDAHQIEGMGLGVFDGTSHTFDNLQDGIGYQFRGRSRNATGFSDWSAWTTAVFQDVLPPVTTINAQTGVWVNQPITVTLIVSDTGCLQSVASITYTLDGVMQPYTGAFTVSAEGNHNLTVFASDGTNNEAPQTRTLLIDRAPPQTILELTNGNLLTATATDALSGVSVTNIRINGGREQALSAPLELDAGNYTIDYASSDYAGNIETWRTISVTVVGSATATRTPTPTAIPTRDINLLPQITSTSQAVATSTSQRENEPRAGSISRPCLEPIASAERDAFPSVWLNWGLGSVLISVPLVVIVRRKPKQMCNVLIVAVLIPLTAGCNIGVNPTRTPMPPTPILLLPQPTQPPQIPPTLAPPTRTPVPTPDLPVPCVSISASPSPAIVGQPVRFGMWMDGGNVNNYTYQWSFGNGATDTRRSPSYSYPDSDADSADNYYTVRLAVSRNGQVVTSATLRLRVREIVFTPVPPTPVVVVTATPVATTGVFTITVGGNAPGPLPYPYNGFNCVLGSSDPNARRACAVLVYNEALNQLGGSMTWDQFIALTIQGEGGAIYTASQCFQKLSGVVSAYSCSDLTGVFERAVIRRLITSCGGFNTPLTCTIDGFVNYLGEKQAWFTPVNDQGADSTRVREILLGNGDYIQFNSVLDSRLTAGIQPGGAESWGNCRIDLTLPDNQGAIPDNLVWTVYEDVNSDYYVRDPETLGRVILIVGTYLACNFG